MALKYRPCLKSFLSFVNHQSLPTGYKTRTTGTPAYLSHLIRNYTYHHEHLRSYEQQLLTIPRTTLALSAKAFSVLTVSVLLQCDTFFSVTFRLRTETTQTDGQKATSSN